MKTVVKVVLCVVAYIVGVMLMGMIAGALHLPSPTAPAGVTQQSAFIGMLFATPLLAAGLTPLAMGLGGSRLKRTGAIMLLIFVALAVNTMIEAKVFSTFLTISVPMICLHYVLPCLSLALALALLFKSSGDPIGLLSFTPIQWAWRIAVAWLAFPVIYFVFGMCVAPFVTDAYLAGVASLRLPPMSVIIKTQLLRSPLFLLSSLPIVALWRGSRTRLIVAFGTAEAVIVGIFGLSQATWLPTVLRIGHSIEITFDSFAYVALLVWLFAPQKQNMPAATPVNTHVLAAS